MNKSLKNFILLFIVVIVFTACPSSSRAAYNAVDVLGQITGTDTPDFTSGLANNSHSTHAIGGATNAVVDTAHHRLFVSDGQNSRILVYNLNTDNTFNHMYPDNIIAQPNLFGTLFGPTQTGTQLQSSIAYDSGTDRLFVTDPGNNRVLIFNTAVITDGMPALYVLGQQDFITSAANSGGMSASTMSAPRGIAYDAARSRLFVGENTNRRILVFDLSGIITNGMPASYVLGAANFTTVGSYDVQALSYDSVDDVLFAAESVNIDVYDVRNAASGNKTMCGNTTNGLAIGLAPSCAWSSITNNGGSSFSSTMRGVFYDAVTHYLFMSDSNGSRVLIANLTSGIPATLTAINVLGKTTFTDIAPGATTASTFPNGALRGLFYEPVSHLFYVGENDGRGIMVFDFTSNILTGLTNGMDASYVLGQTDGNGNQVFTTSNFADVTVNSIGFARTTQLSSVIDHTHNKMFVSDAANNRVLIFNLDSSDNLIDHTADNVLGQTLLTTNTSNLGGLSASSLSAPQGMVYDSTTGYLYVADGGNNRILVYDINAFAATPTNKFAATYAIGQASTSANTAADTNIGAKTPRELTIDTNHHVLYASMANRVVSYPLNSVGTGMTATHEFGQSAFGFNINNNGGTAASTAMNGPWGVAYDATHDYLYVSDTNSNRVLVFNLSGAITITDGMAASNVLGQTGFGTLTTGTTSTTLNTPKGLAYDPAQNALFVADSNNNRVLKYDMTTISNGMAATGVIGQTDFVSFAPHVSQSGTLAPNEVSYDPTLNRLYFNDWSNRVMVFQFPRISPNTFTDTVGAAVTHNFTATSSQGTVSYSLLSGTLPPGLTLGSTLIGTPTTAGVYTFTIQATDTVSGNGTFVSLPTSVTITVASAPVVPVTPVRVNPGIPVILPLGTLSMSVTSTGIVSFNQSVTPAIVSMALSTDPSFANAVITPYVQSSQFSLPLGATTLYARLYTAQGVYISTQAAISSSFVPSSACPFTRRLRRPMTGSDVSCVQNYLNTHQNAGLVVDGVFGRATQAATILFQKSRSLFPDGIVGPLTAAQLR